MKAFLLAAGYGTRLRPITDDIPKCLVPIKGVPLLGWWLKLLSKHGVSDVLINTHYLADAVKKYVGQVNHDKLRIHLVHEETLLGSGGTVSSNRNFVRDDNEFLICYADNLTAVNITKMVDFHKNHQDVLTMGLFKAEHPSQCGIVTIDRCSVITDFVEKPILPVSNLANAGIYIASQRIFEYFPPCKISDFGHDVLPALCHKMRGYVIEEYLRDIGTLAAYKKANEEWNNDYISDTF